MDKRENAAIFVKKRLWGFEEVLAVIDFHTHIVPAVDDGAETLAESLEMLAFAARHGTKEIVLTPHDPLGPYGCGSIEKYTASMTAFLDNPQVKELPIVFHRGCELYAGHEILGRIEREELITVDDTRCVLMEFPTEASFSYIKNVLGAAREKGYRPILAHAERYCCLQEDHNRAESLAMSGVKIQVNAESIIGQNDQYCLSAANSMLGRNIVTLVASDAHDMYMRRPDLSNAHAEICCRFSVSRAERLFRENPQKLLENQ